MTRDDWDNLARDHANGLQGQASGPVLAAYLTHPPGVCLAYAYDDYTHDHRAKLTVTLLREYVRNAGLVELGFSVSDDGRCWVMLVQTNDIAGLSAAMREAWRVASDAEP